VSKGKPCSTSSGKSSHSSKCSPLPSTRRASAQSTRWPVSCAVTALCANMQACVRVVCHVENMSHTPLIFEKVKKNPNLFREVLPCRECVCASWMLRTDIPFESSWSGEGEGNMRRRQLLLLLLLLLLLPRVQRRLWRLLQSMQANSCPSKKQSALRYLHAPAIIMLSACRSLLRRNVRALSAAATPGNQPPQHATPTHWHSLGFRRVQLQPH
jgi:hypothetical protein